MYKIIIIFIVFNYSNMFHSNNIQKFVTCLISALLLNQTYRIIFITKNYISDLF